MGTFDVGGAGLTLACWFYADDFGVHDARFLSKASGAADADHVWMLSTLDGAKARFRLRTQGVTSTLISPSGALTPGEWTHVAGVYDGAAMRLYVNGAEVASMAKAGAVDTDPSIGVAVGNQPAEASGGGRPFDGRIDEVRIYDRALSPADLTRVVARRMLSPRALWLAGHGLPADGLQCEQVIDTAGAIPDTFCSQCGATADCTPGQVCRPSVVIDGLQPGGFLECIDAGTGEDGSLCPPSGDAAACASGICAVVDIAGLGIADIGVCGPCASDDDCPGGTCQPPVVDENGAVPSQCV